MTYFWHQLVFNLYARMFLRVSAASMAFFEENTKTNYW
jgi:hypothetical protein